LLKPNFEVILTPLIELIFKAVTDEFHSIKKESNNGKIYFEQISNKGV